MDEADVTQDRMEAELAFRQLQREAKASIKVAAVTECDCGEEISLTRQFIRATRCYECQVAHEKHVKHFGRPEQ